MHFDTRALQSSHVAAATSQGPIASIELLSTVSIWAMPLGEVDIKQLPELGITASCPYQSKPRR